MSPVQFPSQRTPLITLFLVLFWEGIGSVEKDMELIFDALKGKVQVGEDCNANLHALKICTEGIPTFSRGCTHLSFSLEGCADLYNSDDVIHARRASRHEQVVVC